MVWELSEPAEGGGRFSARRHQKTLEDEVLRVDVTTVGSQIDHIDFYASDHNAEGWWHSRATFNRDGRVTFCRMGFLIAPDGNDLFMNGFKRYVPHFEELPEELKAIVLSDAARGSGIYESEQRIA